MRHFNLPPLVRALITARDELKAQFADLNLRFTLDGNLVGDLGEAMSVELFDLTLTGRSQAGIDGHAPDGRSVQVKASGSQHGAAYRPTKSPADLLLFFHFDYETCTGEVVYNGPEKCVRAKIENAKDQRMVSVAALRRLDEQVAETDRLPMLVQDAPAGVV